MPYKFVVNDPGARTVFDTPLLQVMVYPETVVLDVVISTRMPDSDFITVGTYTSLPEAELAQGILDDIGIESVLLDDNVGRMLSWIAVGGFRLQVNKADADSARKLLTTSTERESSEE